MVNRVIDDGQNVGACLALVKQLQTTFYEKKIIVMVSNGKAIVCALSLFESSVGSFNLTSKLIVLRASTVEILLDIFVEIMLTIELQLRICATGVGLTLTTANIVIFVEMSRTHGDLVQAEDRTHRIDKVLVHSKFLQSGIFLTSVWI